MGAGWGGGGAGKRRRQDEEEEDEELSVLEEGLKDFRAVPALGRPRPCCPHSGAV